jgi:hypothetical protein
VVLGLTIAQAVQWTVGLIFGALAATGVEPDLVVPMAILIGIALLLGLGTQIGMRVWHRQKARQFETLLDRIELAVHDAPRGAQAARPEATDEAPSRLTLDGLADDAPETGRAADRTRQRA